MGAADAARRQRQCLLTFHLFEEHHVGLLSAVNVLVEFGFDRISQFFHTADRKIDLLLLLPC